MDETNNTTQPVQPSPTQQETSMPAPTPVAAKKNMIAILSYLGILIIIPFLVAKDDPFVKFHIKQGLTLIVLSAIFYLGSYILPFFGSLIYFVASVLVLILAILGIINVINNTEKELPLIGEYGSKFNF